jgi:hypothetical protein
VSKYAYYIARINARKAIFVVRGDACKRIIEGALREWRIAGSALVREKSSKVFRSKSYISPSSHPVEIPVSRDRTNHRNHLLVVIPPEVFSPVEMKVYRTDCSELTHSKTAGSVSEESK